MIHCQDTGGGGARPVPIENDPVKSIPKGLLKTISGLAAFMRAPQDIVFWNVSRNWIFVLAYRTGVAGAGLSLSEPQVAPLAMLGSE